MAGLASSSRWEWANRASAPVVASVLGAAVVLARIPLQAALGPRSPFILATPGIIIASLWGGMWPAAIVAVLGLWVGEGALVRGGEPQLNPLGVLIYFAFAFLFAAAGESRRRLLDRLRSNTVRLADMSQRLARVARLTAMGEMGGALAHELNQPLTAIANYAGAAQRLVEHGEPDRAPVLDLLEKISGQAMRAREVIGRIRNYVGDGTPAPSLQSLAAMFEESISIVRAGSVEGFQLKREFGPGADRVLADRVQIEQVMINLIRNAAEAMAGRSRREIRIGARVIENGLVEIWIADSGPGLAPELAEQLFQPFVSGKPGGMGIGLSVTRSIVEAHGGQIQAVAGAEGGAEFRFTLKRAPGAS